MKYIGVDPGLRSGAAGAIDHHGRFIGCFDIPSTDMKRIDAVRTSEELSRLVAGDDAQFVVELVNPMPGQGSVSTGGFMRAAGSIEAIVALKRMTTTLVPPRVWKKAMGLTSEKQDSLEMARKLWPNAPLSRKKDNNRAEALLLAEYIRRMEYVIL